MRLYVFILFVGELQLYKTRTQCEEQLCFVYFGGESAPKEAFIQCLFHANELSVSWRLLNADLKASVVDEL